MATINHQFAFRYDSASALQEENPVLDSGRVGIEYDTRLFKIGDGTTAWRELPYAIINNTQSVFMDVSKDADNAMRISPEDGGLTVPVSVFGINQQFAEGVEYGKTSVTVTEDKKQQIRNENNHSEHQVTAFVLGWALARMANLLGDDVSDILSPTTPSHPLNPQGTPKTLGDLVNPLIQTYIQSNNVGKEINDNVTNLINSWSSKKTLDVIRAQIAQLVGTAPDTLDTIHELSSALINNRDNIGVITEEIGKAVKTSAQSLDTAKQLQARTNIGAVGVDLIGNPAQAQQESTTTGVSESFFTMVNQNLNLTIEQRTWMIPPFC